MHVMREELQVEQFMYDSIINLRGPSKSQKDKSIFHVYKIQYQTLDTEWNTMQE